MEWEMPIPPEAFEALEAAEPCRFADLSSCTRTTGVYTLWDEGLFLYVGIAYRDPEDPNKPPNPSAHGSAVG